MYIKIRKNDTPLDILSSDASALSLSSTEEGMTISPYLECNVEKKEVGKLLTQEFKNPAMVGP